MNLPTDPAFSLRSGTEHDSGVGESGIIVSELDFICCLVEVLLQVKSGWCSSQFGDNLHRSAIRTYDA